MPKRDRSAMDQAHAEINRRILDLELRPAQRIDDLQLASELGLSRTPVREALFQLSSDGLVTVGVNGGFQVKGLELMTVRSLFEAQMVIARAVSRLLAARATDAELDQLEAASRAVDEAVAARNPSGISWANTELHVMEARFSRNEYLDSLAGQIYRQGQRLALLSFGGDGMTDPHIAQHYATACQDHAESIRALRARNADWAEEIAARHVKLFRNRINTFLQSETVDDIHLTGL
jgi:DNA-binding GntR family transcriptional regulator